MNTPHKATHPALGKELQQAAAEASQESAEADKIASLTRAFQMFSEETERLETAYIALMHQFQLVNLQLEDSNAELGRKVRELDVTTQYLNSIVKNMAQGLLFVDMRGTITTYNEAAERILEIASADVLFHTFHEIFEDNAFGFSMREVQASKRAPNQTKAIYTRPKSGSRDLEVSIGLSLNKDGQPGLMQGIIILFRDVTELKQLQLIANRNDRMKELGELAAQVAHEIRNPLGGIRGFATLLCRDLEKQPEQLNLAQYIVRGADRLNELVNQVLDYARPIHIQIETLDLVTIAREVLQSIEADKTFQNSTCQLETTAQSFFMQADPRQMHSLFFNLIINGLQAMPEGGILKVFIGTTKQDIVIRVQDTGSGIDPEHLEKIFSPFFTTKAEGNGLGLAEVYKIVQAYGGTIDVESKLGIGSTFRVYLPSKLETFA